MSSFGSTNKVVSLSQQSTASPRHGAGGSNNTTARIKITAPITWCYENLPTPWRRHVGEWLNEPFWWAWTSLNFYKEYIFLFGDFSLCNFRDLIYAWTACNTSKRKQNLKSHYMTPLRNIWPLSAGITTYRWPRKTVKKTFATDSCQ